MASFDGSIDVNVHISEAFMLFTDFERFPGFMEGVHEVRRTGDDTLHWRAVIGGHENEWDAKITTILPDEKIAWRSTSGSENSGEVTFDKLEENATHVHLHVEYEPEGFVENVGTWLGVVNGYLQGSLERFKHAAERGDAVSEGWHDSPSGEPVPKFEGEFDSNEAADSPDANYIDRPEPRAEEAPTKQ